MKILMIAPTPFFADRGTHIRIYEEACALATLGNFIKIVTYHIGDNPPLPPNVILSRIWPICFFYKKLEAGPSWTKIILDIQLFFRTIFETWRFRPQIIHAHLHEGIFIGTIIQKIFFWQKIILLADFHGTLVQEMADHKFINSDWLLGIIRRLEKYINNSGDVAVTSSPENAAYINLLRTRNAATVLHDGVNLEAFNIVGSKDVLRLSYKLPLNKKIIVYTGAFLKNKGFENLISTFEKLALEPNLHFVIAGGPLKSLEQFILPEIVKNKLTIISPLKYSEIPRILAACDIAIDPKDTDSKQSSGKILTYMAARLPVVCNDRAANADFLASLSSQPLDDQIKEDLNNPNLLNQKIKSNYERAQNFSWLNVGKQLQSTYLKTVNFHR